MSVRTHPGITGVYGSAATGLSGDTSWAANATVARIGADGERRTETVLNQHADRIAVLHDLRVPIRGGRANIDHVLVAGNRVYLLDSKVWKPGFYWTLAGVNRRGTTRVDHTAKDMTWVRDAFVKHLAGTGATVIGPRLVIWSSSTRANPTLWALRLNGASRLAGTALPSAAARIAGTAGRTGADPAIVHRLSTLLVRPTPVPLPVAAGAEHLSTRPLARPTARTGPGLRAVPTTVDPLEDDPFA
ncbi:nuclease-related domain-containing protein [Tersicoccus sp. MR15.9]|uniref:nuclease-related domain-containing protein n=1 Tax=Tersicoccus mangrovi TaxID=3121635 RepID=UPI002FE6A591